MLRRLFLMFVTAMFISLPAFSYVEDGASCVADTFNGVSVGSVDLVANWAPNSYSCEAGKYLSAQAGECLPCRKGYFCPGLPETDFNDEDMGLISCADVTGDYNLSDTSQKEATACYQRRLMPCRNSRMYKARARAIKNLKRAVPVKQEASFISYYNNGDVWEPENEEDCRIVSLECEDGYIEDTVNGELQCVSLKKSCDAGTYLPSGKYECETCLTDHYCPGGTDFGYDDESDQGMFACDADERTVEDGLHSPAGASSVNDCGRILHIANVDKPGEDNMLYLHADKRTTPSIVVDIDGKKWYGDMTPSAAGEKTMSDGTDKILRTYVDGIEYTIHTSVLENESDDDSGE